MAWFFYAVWTVTTLSSMEFCSVCVIEACGVLTSYGLEHIQMKMFLCTLNVQIGKSCLCITTYLSLLVHSTCLNNMPTNSLSMTGVLNLLFD